MRRWLLLLLSLDILTTAASAVVPLLSPSSCPSRLPTPDDLFQPFLVFSRRSVASSRRLLASLDSLEPDAGTELQLAVVCCWGILVCRRWPEEEGVDEEELDEEEEEEEAEEHLLEQRPPSQNPSPSRPARASSPFTMRWFSL